MPRKGKTSRGGGGTAALGGAAAGAAPAADAGEVESLMFAAKETLTHAAQTGLLQDKLSAASQQAQQPATTLVVNDVNYNAPAARGKHYVVAKDSYPSKLPLKVRDEIVTACESDVLELLMTQSKLGYGRRHSAREDTVNEGVFHLDWVQGVRFISEEGKQRPVQADLNGPEYGFQQPKGTDTASKLRIKLYRKKLDDAAKFWSQVEQARADAEREAAEAKAAATVERAGTSGKGRKLRAQQKQKREQLPPRELRGRPAAAEDEATQRTWDSNWEKRAAHLEALLSGLSPSAADGEVGGLAEVGGRGSRRTSSGARKRAAVEKFVRTLLQAKRSGELQAIVKEWERAHPKENSEGSKKPGSLKGQVEQHLVGAERQMDSIVRNLKTVREAVDKLKDYALHSPNWLVDAAPEDGHVLASGMSSDEEQLVEVGELKAALLAASGVSPKDHDKLAKKARSLEKFKAMAVKSLHEAAQNGTLEAAVTEVFGQPEKKTRAVAEASDQDWLGRQSCSASLSASESGALAKELKRKKKEAEKQEASERVRKFLLQALQSGALEAAMKELCEKPEQTSAPEADLPAQTVPAARQTWIRVLENGSFGKAAVDKERLRLEPGRRAGSAKDKGAAESAATVKEKKRREQEQGACLVLPEHLPEAEEVKTQLRAVLEVAGQNGVLQDAISTMLQETVVRDQETQVKLVAVREDLQELRRRLAQAHLVEEPHNVSRDRASAAPSHSLPSTEVGICGSTTQSSIHPNIPFRC